MTPSDKIREELYKAVVKTTDLYLFGMPQALPLYAKYNFCLSKHIQWDEPQKKAKNFPSPV